MKNVRKIILEGKEVYLKRDGENFRVVHPIKNDDGSINWFNFWTGGSVRNLIITAIVVAVLLGLFWEYSSNINHFINCFATPQGLQECQEMYSPWYKKALLG